MNILATVFLLMVLAFVVPFLLVGAAAWFRDWREEREWRRG